MSNLLEINQLIVPRVCAEAAYSHLRRAGTDGVEGVALWAGTISRNQSRVTQTIVPQQTASRTDSGLFYSVEGEELHRINVHLYESGLTLFAQIHSHPGAAYHSQMDDDYPIVTVLGGISVVVPDFAAQPMNLANWAVYRLLPGKGWTRLNAPEVSSLIRIID